MGKRIFAAFVTLVFLYIASPLILPIGMGAILAVLFTPALVLSEKRGVSTLVGSGILTVAITTVVILPGSLLIFFAAKSLFAQLQVLVQAGASDRGFLDSMMDSPRIQGAMVWVTTHVPVNTSELADAFHDFAISSGTKLTELVGGVLGSLPRIGLSVMLVVVSVYFFLLDGRSLVHFVRRNSIFDQTQTERLLATVEGMCRSVILAAVVSGGLQALIEVIACGIMGVSGAAVIGLLVFIGSFLPVVSSAPITLGVALQQFLIGEQSAGIVLLVVAFVIMGVDNLVRPAFLKGSADLHPLLAFVAALGGLQTLGFFGVFFGPIIAALFVTTIQVLASDYKVSRQDSH